MPGKRKQADAVGKGWGNEELDWRMTLFLNSCYDSFLDLPYPLLSPYLLSVVLGPPIQSDGMEGQI